MRLYSAMALTHILRTPVGLYTVCGRWVNWAIEAKSLPYPTCIECVAETSGWGV